MSPLAPDCPCFTAIIRYSLAETQYCHLYHQNYFQFIINQFLKKYVQINLWIRQNNRRTVD